MLHMFITSIFVYGLSLILIVFNKPGNKYFEHISVAALALSLMGTIGIITTAAVISLQAFGV